jgi:hypothetical protein
MSKAKPSAPWIRCLGVLGVGQIDASGALTLTNTVGLYTQVTKQVSLAGNAEMNQLGGLASTSAGTGMFCLPTAGSNGQIAQDQQVKMNACAMLPGGFANSSYVGNQSAKLNAGSF